MKWGTTYLFIFGHLQDSPKVSGTKHADTEPYKIYKAILGVSFPYINRIHTAYIGEDTFILGT